VIKQLSILLCSLFITNIQSQTDSLSYYLKQDSLLNKKYLIEKTISQATLHKYYIYADAWNFINGAGLHFEINVKNRKLYADYLNVFLGFRHDDDWIKNYPDLRGEYLLASSIYYVLIKKKRKINFEFSLGGVINIGDPVARDALQSKFGNSKILFYNGMSLALRYNFEKVPIQLRLSTNTFYSFTRNQFIPIIPSFSIGYGFIKIKNEQKTTIQTYSNSPY
jgi:hypothetical protein